MLDQVLKLPDEERGEFASRLLRSLELEDGDELGAQEWDSVWSTEIDHRVPEIRDGSVELVDGDDVLAELREIVERP